MTRMTRVTGTTRVTGMTRVSGMTGRTKDDVGMTGRDGNNWDDLND